MTKKKQLAISAVAATSLVLGGVAPALAATNDAPESPAAEPQASFIESDAASLVKAASVQGAFTWNQGVLTPNSVIREVFRTAVAALCNGTDDFVQVNPLQWQIAVSGDVENAFTATVDDLAQEESVKQTMSCTCGGNPVDGRATITADVKGVPVMFLASQAKAKAGVNTVTFISSDGTELAMPFVYVRGHHGVISYEINGEDLSASVGGNNQLWLESTSANNFIRDIVEVRFTAEETVPANPGEGQSYPNVPNIGISSADVA